MVIARSKLHWITEAGMFFERKGPVWETLRKLDRRLTEAGIDYVVIGGLALNAHAYPRQTVDVDVVLTTEGFAKFRTALAGRVYKPAGKTGRRFTDPETETAIDFLIAGQLAGRTSKNHTVRFPSPDEEEVHGGLRTVSLARLIELKLVTWRFKDWGDVVELIRRHHLPESFADPLDPAVRGPFGECFDQANAPDYEGPLGSE